MTNPEGRPSEYNTKVLALAAGAYALGHTDQQVADLVGVSVTTIYNWKLRHPEFLEASKGWKAVADDQVEQSLFAKAKAGDTTAMIFWLKNRRRAEWRDRIDHNVSGSLGEMTDEQVEDRYAELQAKIAAKGENKP